MAQVGDPPKTLFFIDIKQIYILACALYVPEHCIIIIIVCVCKKKVHRAIVKRSALPEQH